MDPSNMSQLEKAHQIIRDFNREILETKLKILSGTRENELEKLCEAQPKQLK